MNVVVGAVLILSGLLVAVVGRRAATGRLGRNHLAGIRTKRSMADDASWRAVHLAAEPWMLAAGMALVLAGAAAAAIRSDAVLAAVSVGGAVLCAVLVLAASAVGHAALRDDDRDG